MFLLEGRIEGALVGVRIELRVRIVSSVLRALPPFPPFFRLLLPPKISLLSEEHVERIYKKKNAN